MGSNLVGVDFEAVFNNIIDNILAVFIPCLGNARETQVFVLFFRAIRLSYVSFRAG